MIDGPAAGRPASSRAGPVDAPRAESRPARHAFPILDGLRGVAALAVVTFHYQPLLGPLVFGSAYLAVDLFFLISGIVIAHAYERRLQAGLGAWAFMKKRVVRLLPLYAMGLGIGAGVAILGMQFGNSAWTWPLLLPVVLSGALMLPNVFPAPRGDLYPLNIPCWSLFWELIVNLAYALSIRWLTKRVLVGAIVAAQVLLAVAAWRAGGLDFGYDWHHPEIAALRVVAEFLTGVAIARLAAAGRLWRLSVPPLLILAAAGALLALPVSLGWAKDVACAAVAFPLLCVAALGSTTRWRGVHVWLGLISYPLYVVHATLPWYRLSEAALHVSPAVFAPWSGILAMAAAVALSWGLARFYDVPVRAWLAAMTSRRARLA